METAGHMHLSCSLFRCSLMGIQAHPVFLYSWREVESATEAAFPCSYEQYGRMLASRVGGLLSRIAWDQAGNRRDFAGLLDALSIQRLPMEALLQRHHRLYRKRCFLGRDSAYLGF